MKIILYGPPGAGKDTQGRLLAERYGVPFVSTGQLLREEMGRPSDLGQAIVPYMHTGALVPPELVDQVMERTFTDPRVRHGYVLNGFPRTARTVAWYLEREKPSLAVVIDLPESDVRFRLQLRARFDDHPGAINKRLELYRTHVPDVLAAFAESGVQVVRIDGAGEVRTVEERVRKALVGPLR